ncbi:YlbE-like family protein [Virgibacillus sp. LDC-1]|uniref:YlbE-like family protein n=1 Tax=Virgibacillus sp. LDC-1 TaxID=3039856 RepID=UPI0024DE7B12|nr:YlbE-like family protein [Virgibacillus sp. LDC-1]
MDKRVTTFLQTRPDLQQFIRSNPIWYRFLARDPNQLAELEKEAKVFYGKTMPQRLEKANDRVQLLGMLLQFAETMKD